MGLFSIVLAAQILAGGRDISVFYNALASGLATAIYIVGIIEYWRNRKTGRIPRRKSFKLMIYGATVLWAALLVVAIIAVLSPGQDYVVDRPVESLGIWEYAGLIIALYLVSLFSMALMVLLAFGAVGLVSAVTRRFTPSLLASIRGISGKDSPKWTDRTLAWVYGIPDTLDTRTLKVAAPQATDSFPTKSFTRAVLWELVLGTILAVYVAFNPFLERGTDLVSLFGVLQGAAVIVPLVMLPWFVYMSVDATIKGATKDFRLYDGIKARIFRSYIAVGTLVVFVRVSLTEIDLDVAALQLVGYISALLAAATLFTFIYYNHFDREMTTDIITGFNRLQEEK